MVTMKNNLLVSSKILYQTENKPVESFYEMWCFPLEEKNAPFGLLRMKKNVFISDFIVLSPSLMVLARTNEEKKTENDDIEIKESILELYSLDEDPKKDEKSFSISRTNSIFKIPHLFKTHQLKLKNFKNESKFFLFAKSKIFFFEIKNQKEFFLINETLLNPLYCCLDSCMITQNWEDLLICLDLFSGYFYFILIYFYFYLFIFFYLFLKLFLFILFLIYFFLFL